MRIIKYIIFIIVIFSLIFLLIRNIDINKDSQKLKSLCRILESQDSILAKDFFDFDFARGYVMNEPYVSGKTFSEMYNLNINIWQVGPQSSDFIRRIVFVNAEGNFVSLFRYNPFDAKAYFIEDGLIIYPFTKILKLESSTEDFLKLKFDSEDYYYDRESILERVRYYNVRDFTEAFTDRKEMTVSNIFNNKFTDKKINFHHGYVLKGGSSSGDEFADRYNLNIYISEVLKVKNDNIYRIILVDDYGYFVAEYQYSADKITFEDIGIIIYPYTKVTKTYDEKSNEIFKFDSEEHYDNF